MNECMLPHSESNLISALLLYVFKIVSVRSKNAFCVCESVRNLPQALQPHNSCAVGSVGTEQVSVRLPLPKGNQKQFDIRLLVEEGRNSGGSYA